MLATSDHLRGLQDMEPLAQSLLKHGAKLDIADHVRQPSLNRLQYIEMICSRIRPVIIMLHIQIGWTPIMKASYHNWINLVQLYLDHGADPNQIADVRPFFFKLQRL